MKIEKLGLRDYTSVEALQLKRVEEVSRGLEAETLFICSHSPCVTLGRSTKPSDVVGWAGETHQVSRGGRATYHGPSQMVAYPIIDLSKTRAGLRSKDLHHYLQLLSEVTCAVLSQHYGLKAQSQPETPELFGSNGLYFTGVWAGNKKLGSIGIAVKKWVAYHGIAINLFEDAAAFSGLVPCGFQSNVMAHLEGILGYKVDRDAFEDQWSEVFLNRIN